MADGDPILDCPKMPKKFTLHLLYILTLLQSCFPICSASYTVAKVHLCPSSGTLVRTYRTLRPLIYFLFKRVCKVMALPQGRL